MAETTSPEMREAARTSDRPGVRVILVLAGFLILGALLFGSAGRIDWVAGWLYMALSAAAAIAGRAVIGRRNPELLAVRWRIGRGTKAWDRVWLGAARVVIPAILVVAAIDAVRFGWSAMATGWWAAGAVTFALAFLLIIWSMAENPHFEATVRIQHDRGHKVIDSGPYRVVRHPGYVGFMAALLATPLLLLSWWALVPASAAAASLVLRTALEDRVLRRELAGYAEYAQRVRFRLVPGIW